MPTPQVNINEAHGKIVFEINHHIGGVTHSLTLGWADAAVVRDKLDSSFERLSSTHNIKQPKKKKYTIVSEGQPHFMPPAPK